MTEPLNKAQVLAGLRCHKKLWIEFHEEYPPALRRTDEQLVRFAEGRVVGEEARRQLAPGIHLAPEGGVAQERVLERTRHAIAAGEARLFEAAFRGGGASIRADVLERDGDAWRLIEVKQSRWPEADRDREKKFEIHVPDAAVQVYAMRQAGERVSSAHLMYLNPECRHPDLSNLFATVDVTNRVNRAVDALGPAVRAMQDMLAQPGVPDVAIGDQCNAPEPCPFWDRCHPPLPEHHVSELYYARRKAANLESQGKTLISHLTEADAPNAPAKRQVRAVTTGRRVVEPGLGAALAALVEPMIHLDFETVQLAVPRWHGCRPQDTVAVQFSVHRDGADGTGGHVEYLARRGTDPRPALIDALVEACRDARTILVYYEPFEKTRIEELAAWFPARRAELMDIHARIVDLLPIIRDHVYDPAFHGSFSLKKVLPALVPDLGYGDLAIQEGGAAAAAIYRLLFDQTLDAAGQDALRADLLAYCHRDTEAMVRLVATLRALAT